MERYRHHHFLVVLLVSQRSVLCENDVNNFATNNDLYLRQWIVIVTIIFWLSFWFRNGQFSVKTMLITLQQIMTCTYANGS
jgi:hypothetical protein